MRVHQGDGFEHVAEVLTHLATVFVQDVAEANDVLIRRFSEDKGPDGHQGVEPTAGLIDRLTNEVGGVLLRELFHIPARVPQCGEGHGAGVVPAVDDLRHSMRRVSALWALNRDIVDERAVRIEIVDVLTGT